MKSLKGFAAIGIILHHISQEDAFQYASQYNQLNELSFFLNYGFKLVAIFFFCSGYGLIKSYQSKRNYLKGFLKKRVLKTLIIPFYVSILIYGIWHLIRGDTFAPLQWITNLTGLTMMNEFAWFPIVLSILYLTFYFVYNNIDDRKSRYLFIFMIIIVQGLYFCLNGHFSWWASFKNWWLLPSAFDNVVWWMKQKVWLFSGEWWVNSEIAFLAGIFIAENEEDVRDWFSHSYWIKLLGMIIVYLFTNKVAEVFQGRFGYWSEFSGTGPGILNKIICFVTQLPQVISYIFVIYVILMKYQAENPISRFFGDITFETYMMNLLILSSFRFLIMDSNSVPIYKEGHWNLAVYTVCVIAGTILAGLLYKWTNRQINKKIS